MDIVYIAVTFRDIKPVPQPLSSRSSTHHWQKHLPGQVRRSTLCAQMCFGQVIFLSCHWWVSPLRSLPKYLETNKLGLFSDCGVDWSPLRMQLKSVWEMEICSRPWRLPMSTSATPIPFPQKTNRGSSKTISSFIVSHRKENQFFCCSLTGGLYAWFPAAGVSWVHSENMQAKNLAALQ